MVSVSSVINIPPVVNAALSTQPVAQVDRVSTRITPIAVSAPIASEHVEDNNTQRDVRQVVIRTSADQSAPQAKTAVATGSSSPFVTQLLSQASSQSAAVQQTFVPALQYNTLVGYGFVKYKPSDAGLPVLRANKPAQNTPTAEPVNTTATTEYQAYNDSNSRVATQQNPSSIPVVISG